MPDVIKLSSSEVRHVTSVRTVCEAMNKNAHKSLLSEVHKLLRLYFTIPITTSTSERTFSVLRQLLTYLRSTMSEERLNNCLLLHVHKDITDALDYVEIAKNFIDVNPERKKYFGNT